MQFFWVSKINRFFFCLFLGIAVGPVVAGVIGARKYFFPVLHKRLCQIDTCPMQMMMTLPL